VAEYRFLDIISGHPGRREGEKEKRDLKRAVEQKNYDKKSHGDLTPV
jgi:hypothetical protein